MKWAFVLSSVKSIVRLHMSPLVYGWKNGRMPEIHQGWGEGAGDRNPPILCRHVFPYCAPFGIWPATGGSIMTMPGAGNKQYNFIKWPRRTSWPLATQVSEAVKFIMLPAWISSLPTFRTTIIDFGTSVQLRTQMQLLCGHVGTRSYVGFVAHLPSAVTDEFLSEKSSSMMIPASGQCKDNDVRGPSVDVGFWYRLLTLDI